MSYQVLARKWRPRSFAALVGQEHVVRALTHALETGRLHHAYLFTGTRGVGKTTLARILAKALNCETGVTATPCGQCSACTEIDAGRFVDLIEVDAATNTGVDDVRALQENATYAPTRGRYKVFVIDEVHMLSKPAFNSMLKTLEEPPEHIKFILATTDPQKIPVTVLSRCLQFNLKQMPQGHIAEHLGRVLQAEGIGHEPGALRHIAKAAAGSMRDALSLLDQAIAHGAGRVEEGPVRDMLGTVGDEHLFELLEGIAAGDVPALLQVAQAMDARSLSCDSALQELSGLLHRIALLQFAPGALGEDPDRARLAAYAQRFDAEYLQLAYQIAVQGRADLPLAPDERAGFSMTLLRMVAFRPHTPPSGGEGRPTPAPASAQPPRRPPEPPPAAQPRTADSRGARASAAPQPPASLGEQVPAAAPPASAPGGHRWLDLIQRLGIGGMARELAQHCEWLGIEGELVRLRLSPAHRALLVKASQDKLQAALQAHLGRPVRLQIEVAEPEAATPAQQLRDARQERHERAVAALEQDRFVRDAIELFDATLNEASIKPL